MLYNTELNIVIKSKVIFYQNIKLYDLQLPLVWVNMKAHLSEPSWLFGSPSHQLLKSTRELSVQL